VIAVRRLKSVYYVILFKRRVIAHNLRLQLETEGIRNEDCKSNVRKSIGCAFSMMAASNISLFNSASLLTVSSIRLEQIWREC